MSSEDAAPDADAALDAALAARDDAPECAVCPSSADFFLYDPGRVAKFVCWEHVSPVAAAVDEDPENTNRPVAHRLD